MATTIQPDAMAQWCDKRRTAIMALCQKLATDGAHYLWGAEGLRPSSKAPHYFAPRAVSLDKSARASTTFAAAQHFDQDAQRFVCAGRCFVVSSPANAIIANPASDNKLEAFIKNCIDKHLEPWNCHEKLTPRLILGTGDGEPRDYNESTEYTKRKQGHLDKTLVWGESCNDKLHFDCGGFVRWVVSQVCAMSIAGISKYPTQKNAFGQPMARLLTKDDTVMKADILVYAGHIAFATGTPALKYDPHTHYNVAQADCATNGVNYNVVHQKDNTSCIRLSDSTLVGSALASTARAGTDVLTFGLRA